jgi:hypothetical protein
MTVCYVLYYDFNLPSAANYVIALPVELIFTVAVFELFRRIPFVRYWVLGIKGKRAHA